MSEKIIILFFFYFIIFFKLITESSFKARKSLYFAHFLLGQNALSGEFQTKFSAPISFDTKLEQSKEY